MVSMTFKELQQFLNTLTEEQLAMPATVYAGDVDDCIQIFETCFNTAEDMGESIADYSDDQPFLLI
jgi:hypothetical protein